MSTQPVTTDADLPKRIKELEQLNDNMRLELKGHRLAIANIEKELSYRSNELNKLKTRQKNLQKGVACSDHAVVRYVERIVGIGKEDIIAQFLTDDVVEQIKTAGGSGKFPSGDVTLVVKDYVVVTVIN